MLKINHIKFKKFAKKYLTFVSRFLLLKFKEGSFVMEFEYFYGSESEQFAFYRIPKILFKDKLFKDVSTDAKVLYGLILDRMGLSMKNGWLDDNNRVYIIYTITDIMEDLNCADQKANKLLSELDTAKGIGLIERKRQGLGKPNIIYVKNFRTVSQIQNRENHDSREVKITNQEILKSQIQKCENHDSRIVNISIQESLKSRSNNTNINNTDNSYTEYSDNLSYPIISDNNDIGKVEVSDSMRWIEERKTYEELIKNNIEYDIIVNQYEKQWLDEIVAIMVDVVCSKEPYIRINKQEYPQEIVKNRFLKINSYHIEYIDLALKDNTTKVRNIRAFLITTIYRSFETTGNWYASKVRHDMSYY